MKTKIYVDLDGTLWQTDAKAWIVDKINPNKPIIKLEYDDFVMITKGYHSMDKNKVSYNGLEGWLSNEQLTKIKSKKPIDINNIGISLREFTNIEFIQNQNKSIKFLTKNFENLNLNSITLLTARANKDGHKFLLDMLEAQLTEINIKLDDSIFINDLAEFKNKNTGNTPTKKLIKIIESLIGFKIVEDKFVPLMVTEYDNIEFYDDDDENISICNEINMHILNYYSNSSSLIKNRISNKMLDKKRLITHLVTSNLVNLFETKTIQLNNI